MLIQKSSLKCNDFWKDGKFDKRQSETIPQAKILKILFFTITQDNYLNLFVLF